MSALEILPPSPSSPEKHVSEKQDVWSFPSIARSAESALYVSFPPWERRRLAWPKATRNHGAVSAAGIKVEMSREAANPDRLSPVLRNKPYPLISHRSSNSRWPPFGPLHPTNTFLDDSGLLPPTLFSKAEDYPPTRLALQRRRGFMGQQTLGCVSRRK